MQLGHQLRQLDVTTAFLYGELQETIFIKCPEGYSIPDSKTMRLRKSIYDLRQSPKCWNATFDKFVASLGFVKSKADPCLYVLHRGDEIVYMLLYVDDIIMSSNKPSLLDELVNRFNDRFKMKDLGRPERFMGINLIYAEDGKSLSLDQADYVAQILNKFGMSD